MNVRARVERGIGITAGVFAIDNDSSHLAGLRRVRPEHKILIGDQGTGTDTSGETKGLPADIAGLSEKLLRAIESAKGFMETDAFLLLSSAAGGTGSGTMPVLTQRLREWHPEKPAYNLIVLPFEDEEKTQGRTRHNTVTSLKSAYKVANAVFLFDNQRYVTKDYFVRDNLAKVNASIVEPFYEMLCAGEEKIPGYIGSKTLDAGDIIQTLAGWTVIGQGKVRIPRFRLPFYNMTDFRDKLDEMQKGIKALNGAISELSLKCNPADASRALFLLAAPAAEMGLSMFTNIGSLVKDTAPGAIIRSGDYPRNRDSLSVTIILSELTRVDRLTDYFNRVAGGVALPVPPVAGPSTQPESPKSDKQSNKPKDDI